MKKNEKNKFSKQKTLKMFLDINHIVINGIALENLQSVFRFLMNVFNKNDIIDFMFYLIDEDVVNEFDIFSSDIEQRNGYMKRLKNWFEIIAYDEFNMDNEYLIELFRTKNKIKNLIFQRIPDNMRRIISDMNDGKWVEYIIGTEILKIPICISDVSTKYVLSKDLVLGESENMILLKDFRYYSIQRTNKIETHDGKANENVLTKTYNLITHDIYLNLSYE